MDVSLGEVYNAFVQLREIVPQNRPIPQRGAYWLARLYSKLGVEFVPISQRRDAMIIAYDHKNESGANVVPPDKTDEWAVHVGELFAERIDVDVRPLRVDWLMLDEHAPGAITALEIVNLGPFVVDE